MARYILTITQIGREPSIDKTVYEGDDWKMALKQFRDSVSRSQGEWSNYVFIGQSVTLIDSRMTVRHYVGSKAEATVNVT